MYCTFLSISSSEMGGADFFESGLFAGVPTVLLGVLFWGDQPFIPVNMMRFSIIF